MLLAEESVEIACALEVVRSQFGDVAHHQRQGLHRGVHFEVIADDGATCRYRQVTAVGPLRLGQDLVVDRSIDGPLLNLIVAGQFHGGVITFEFTDGDGVTRVTATVEAPLRGIGRVTAPLVRAKVARSLRRALAEDQADLESGTYAGGRAAS